MGGIRAFFRVLNYAPASEQRKFLYAQIGVVFVVIAQLMIPNSSRTSSTTGCWRATPTPSSGRPS